MNELSRRHPRLSLPFTVLSQPDTVRLVAGEDFRYSFSAPKLDAWLPDFLARLDGNVALSTLLQNLPETQRADAQALIERLYGERVLVDGNACEAHRPASARIVAEGSGALLKKFESGRQECLPHLSPGLPSQEMPDVLNVLCQDRLDYDAALNFNQRCMKSSEDAAWIWVTTGPLSRAYVSPVFLKNAGPCLACLIHHFKSLSPAPEIYEHLIEHAQAKRAIAPVVDFPETALTMLEQIVRWKREQLSLAEPAAALYRLHVLEVETLEVSTHRVFAFPQCSACART